MGKKRSTFKNIMVTLGCTAFAGAYALGGGYAATVFLGGGDGSKPEWLERVEINVNENASDNTIVPGSGSGSMAAGSAGAGGLAFIKVSEPTGP